jgi:hypothetical protein
MSNLGEQLPEDASALSVVQRIFDKASDLESDILIDRFGDWEGVQGTQPDGCAISLGRPILSLENESLQENRPLVYQVVICYPLASTELETLIIDGYERTYLIDSLGNIRLIHGELDTVVVGPGECSDLAERINNSIYS